ncbi:xylose isomerase [Anoxybacter fermentans]|uniref:Xylose isomerase n=1 Tax=Anoxybacter fermentans TaxID=1323375 RepID=A0A3S9SV41_9FIRM|nr:TIM barrel protein [Anoxybacter fermentans]AZR72183.1 xylose isomerase [Anoxybacter fermentans]
MLNRIKNSVGIWAFGENVTRFVPKGYHREVAGEKMPDKVKRVVEGLEDWIDGYEFHYPNEINEENVDAIKEALGDKDIYAIPLGFHILEEFIHGSFINPKKEVREYAIRLAKQAVDLAAQEKAHLIIWPGGEGYNYPFQAHYSELWKRFINGVGEVVEYAGKKGVTVLLEHKNSEPAMCILMRNIGMTIFLINKIKELGVDVSNLKINMDWQHLIMNGEPLAEYAALLGAEGLLGHHHANSGWGTFDDDNMTGSSNFMQILGIAKELQRMDYGKNGERIGFDLFPYTEDPIEAVKQSVIQWEFIYDLAKKIDDDKLLEAQRNKDAVAAYKTVYEGLGLDQNYIDRIYAERQKL